MQVPGTATRADAVPPLKPQTLGPNQLAWLRQSPAFRDANNRVLAAEAHTIQERQKVELGMSIAANPAQQLLRACRALLHAHDQGLNRTLAIEDIRSALQAFD